MLLFPYLSSSKKASALLITFFVVFIVCSLLGTLLLPLTLRSSASQFDIEKFHALNIAEAGLANVMDNIQNGGTGALGTKSAPLPYHHGSYYTLITLKTPSLLLNEIQVIGNYRRATCTVKIVTDYPIPAEGTPPILDENPLIPLSEPIFSKGNITITGSTDLTASVRSNKTITAQGSGLKFNGDLKAAEKVKLIGKPKILGEILEGVEPLDLPPLVLASYKPQLEYLLKKDGTVCDSDGNCIASSPFQSWQFVPSSSSATLPEWNYLHTGSEPPSGSYYVEGHVTINKSSTVPWSLTVIAEGHITVSSQTYLTPYHSEKIGLIAGTDLSISGNTKFGLGFYGAKEQIKIVGTPQIDGSLYSEDEAMEDSLVTSNNFSGSSTLMATEVLNFPALSQNLTSISILSVQILYQTEQLLH